MMRWMGDMQNFPHKHKTVNSQERCCRCHSKSPQPKRCALWGELTSLICWDCICSGCLLTFNLSSKNMSSSIFAFFDLAQDWEGLVSWPLVSWGLTVVATSHSPVCTSSEGTRALEAVKKHNDDPNQDLKMPARNRTHQKQVGNDSCIIWVYIYIDR